MPITFKPIFTEFTGADEVFLSSFMYSLADNSSDFFRELVLEPCNGVGYLTQYTRHISLSRQRFTLIVSDKR